ncbi:YbhB/YbcL family Raf kinase inhibitor-like protein [Variovorax soli]|uniref:Raf kinase inhibitor-like YbhB/YbcL family protein n=1 Tax=Variovorax soli TaxID=376815 RepID=A0ABU1NDK3_9BURK|nr:YbhB/YbcL family Raf kinase inhibitor-like protein [Variovorax soli]MDR6536544.1 Raf kinase inhibitor-like YbhB/YbcL family protein [Variovorax soli]
MSSLSGMLDFSSEGDTRMTFLRLLILAVIGLPLLAHAEPFTVTSSSFRPGTKLPEAYVYQGMGCSGGNTSPALRWRGAPQGTKSFAVTVYDPDAPTGSGWWHWIVYNLPADTVALPEGAGRTGGSSLPAGAIQGRNDFGAAGYGGPCPPAGDKPHRYRFTVHALKIDKLALPPEASAAVVDVEVRANQLAQATLEAKYGR